MNAATRLFIEAHADDDVHQLAFLAARYPDVDMPFVPRLRVDVWHAPNCRRGLQQRG